MTTHQMDVVEEICDRVAIINQDKLIALDSAEKLCSAFGREYYEVRLKGRPDISVLKALPIFRDIEVVHVDAEKAESLIRLVMDREDCLFEAIESLRGDGVRISSFTNKRYSRINTLICMGTVFTNLKSACIQSPLFNCLLRRDVFMERNYLKYKRVLIVDDEPDVLETLEGLLEMCDVVKASDFDSAKKLLEVQYFDIAVLDIMGVDGYKLLEIANKRDVMAVMLTAHALSPEDTVKSFKEGAAYYVPKEKMSDITTYLNDILEAKEKGKKFWWRWLDRFAYFYDEKFGPDWRNKDKEFWENFRGGWL